MYPKLDSEQERKLKADLFEQIMLFDRVYLKTGRVNFALFFILKHFGLKVFERLLETKYIKFLLYTPMIVADLGRQQDDGTLDESTIIGKPPIISRALDTGSDYRERTIDIALDRFDMRSKAKKNLKKKILKNVIKPDGMTFSTDAAEYVTDAYTGNLLEDIGMPYEQEPEQLNKEQRGILQDLSLNVLETTLLSKYELKSFNQQKNSKLYQKNLSNIGDALKVTDNAVDVFNLENIPDLRELYLDENLSIEEALKLRHGSNAKYFRKWINSVSENKDAKTITEEYIDEIKDRKGFFQSNTGKFIKTTTTFGLGLGIATALGNPIAAIPATYGLRLLDTYVLQDLTKGKNAKMFIDQIKENVE